jgi:hypothetical protein
LLAVLPALLLFIGLFVGLFTPRDVRPDAFLLYTDGVTETRDRSAPSIPSPHASAHGGARRPTSSSNISTAT